jgi:hypothetical protein
LQIDNKEFYTALLDQQPLSAITVTSTLLQPSSNTRLKNGDVTNLPLQPMVNRNDQVDLIGTAATTTSLGPFDGDDIALPAAPVEDSFPGN